MSEQRGMSVDDLLRNRQASPPVSTTGIITNPQQQQGMSVEDLAQSKPNLATSPNSAQSQQQTNEAPSQFQDYMNAIGRAAIRTGTAFMPNLEEALGPEHENYTGPKPMPPSEALPKILPEPQGTGAKTLEGATEGAIPGAAFGPAGAVVGAVSGGTTAWLNSTGNPNHPIANQIWGLISGMVAPTAGNIFLKTGRLLGEGIGAVERSPLVQAWQDQGVTGRTAAGVGPEGSMPKTVRTYRESPLSNAINEKEELGSQQLQGAVERQANTLGTATTPQEAGTQARAAMENRVQDVKNIIATGNNWLNARVNPGTTDVPMYNTVSNLIDKIAPTAGAEAQSSGLLPKAQSYLNNLITDIQTRNNRIPGNNDSLPLAAVKEVKRNIGDLLEQSIMNGDTSKRQLKLIYGELANAERSAYANTPYAMDFHNLQAASSQYYSGLEQFVEPFLKEGFTPERIYQQLTSGARLGDTKLAGLFQMVPGARGPISSAVLQNLGMDQQRNFDPNRFFTNWRKLPPESKQTLFGGPNGLDKAYDQLSLLAQRQGESEKARNFSGTGGVNEGFTLARQWFRAVSGLAGSTAGAGASYLSGMGGQESILAGMAGGAGGASLGTPLLETAANAWVPRLLTNPGFVRWLATPAPLDKLPLHIKALSSVAAQWPNVAPEVTAFQNWANGQVQNAPQQGEKGRGFMGGGYSGWPEQTPSGYADGGLADNNDDSSLIDNIMSYRGGGSVWPGPEPIPFVNGGMVNGKRKMDHLRRSGKKRLADGGPIDQIMMAAQGGIAHNKNDTRPFYNPQLPGVNEGGWNNGGPVSGSEIGEYSTGGSVDQSDDSMIDHILKIEGTGKNLRSSASGKGQFLDSTWKYMINKYHPEIADPMSVKGDPALGKEMTIKYAQENAAKLKSQGIDVTPSNIHLAHFLGPEGATKVLTASDTAPLSAVIANKAIAANPFLNGMKVADLKNWSEAKMEGKSSQPMHQDKNTIKQEAMPKDQPEMLEAEKEDVPASMKDHQQQQDSIETALLNSADEDVKPLIELILSG